MTAKDYLNQIRLLDVKIRQKQEEKEYLESVASGNHSPALSKDKVQSSIQGNKMENAVIKYADLEKEIDQMILDLVILRHKIIDQIQQLTDEKYVELLQLKYVGKLEGKDVHYLRLEEIACTMKKSNGMPYSYEHIRSLHGKALQEFSKIM